MLALAETLITLAQVAFWSSVATFVVVGVGISWRALGELDGEGR